MTYPGYTGATPTYYSATDSWSVSGQDSVRFPTYDNAGHLTARVDGNGVTTTYTHSADPQSLLTLSHYTYPTGYTGGTTGDVSLSHDQYGRPTSTTDGTGTRTATYDDGNALLSVVTAYTGLPSQTVSYGYNPDGSRSAMGTPAGSFSYSYDADGRMSGLTNPFSEQAQWTYQDNGWLASRADPGMNTAYTYTAKGELQLAVDTLPDVTHSQDVFGVTGRDGVGNETGDIDYTFGQLPYFRDTAGYQYDGRGQVTQEHENGNPTAVPFTYDGGIGTGPGNPTTFRGVSHSYNADNGGSANTYDGDGNPTTYSGTSLAFDPEGRLTAYGTALTCGYRGDGLRAWKQGSSGRTYFLYDGDAPVCELDATGAVVATNTFGADGLLSRHPSAGSLFFGADMRGNVSLATYGTGYGAAEAVYDAFGALIDGSGTGVFGFSGQWGGYTDSETGLVLMTHRYYDPATGRFLTRDPMGYGGGVNLYAYTQNDPVNFSDPSGFGLNNGTVTNSTGTTQYGLGGFDPGEYGPTGPIRYGYPVTIAPKPGHTGPVYTAYPIMPPWTSNEGDDYIFPIAPGSSVGGHGVDIDAGWDPCKSQWSKVPGTEIHGIPVFGNVGNWNPGYTGSVTVGRGNVPLGGPVYHPPYFYPGWIYAPGPAPGSNFGPYPPPSSIIPGARN